MSNVFEKQLGKRNINMKPWGYTANGDAIEQEALDEVFGSLEANRVAGGLDVGRKHDSDKPAMELLPPLAIEALARVLGYGAAKYSPDNWRKVENGHSRYLAAALRHVFARLRGERLDPESGQPHLAHAACSLLFAIELDHE